MIWTNFNFARQFADLDAVHRRRAKLNLEPRKLPEGIGDVKPVEIMSAGRKPSPVKLGSSKQEPSGCSPEMVAV